MSSVFVKSLAASAITSPLRQRLVRWTNALALGLSGRPGTVNYYHRVDDPYCYLMVQLLPELARRYPVQIEPQVISRLEPAMYPEAEMLADYALADAGRLAEKLQLSFPKRAVYRQNDLDVWSAPLALLQDDPEFFAKAKELGEAYFGSSEPSPANGAAIAGGIARLRNAEADLARRGHYLSATLNYAGEWYWGPDRLHYLEERLGSRAIGQIRPIAELNTETQAEAPAKANGRKTPRKIVYYFSLRSPYSYIGFFKVRRLAEKYGCKLELRPVLPMVMRQMQVPWAKRKYILLDAKREASHFGLKFGRIADPIGSGIERAYAVADLARKKGELQRFIEAAFPAIMAEGVNVASDTGLKQVCQRAGLDWHDCQRALGEEGWRGWVEQNRAEMLAQGCWGVPSIQYADLTVWGQDRLWAIEDAIRADQAGCD